MPEIKADEIVIEGEKFIPLLTEEVIQKRIKELGAQISSEYSGKVPVLIGILNGSFGFRFVDQIYRRADPKGKSGQLEGNYPFS
ncbi:MAG: hypothetical protein P8Z35_23035 [Ignavibacteriaceae bacterium]